MDYGIRDKRLRELHLDHRVCESIDLTARHDRVGAAWLGMDMVRVPGMDGGIRHLWPVMPQWVIVYP